MEASQAENMVRQSAQESIDMEDEQANLERKRGGWITFPFIIGTVMGLSIAAGGWASNLIVFFITEFNVKSITATQINNVVLGCNSLFPIAGAFIADSFFTSFSVISFFAFVSLLGMIILTLTSTIQSLKPSPCSIGSPTCQAPSNLQFAGLYATLALASLGLGGTRFTIATMGADQYDNTEGQGRFFSWYFLALYVANAVSFTAIIYIQDRVSWGLGFGICVIANTIGLAVFFLGKRFYLHIEPKGSPFISIARVVVAATRKRKMPGNFQGQDYYHGDNGVSKVPLSAPTSTFRFLNMAALKTEGDVSQLEARSWKLCTVEEVEDLKTLIKIIPLWSTGIFLSTIMAMFSSLTILQALTMNRQLLHSHFKIPASSFLVFNLLATAISIFFIDRFFLSTWQNLTRQHLTPLQRIGIGHIITVVTMMGSALIESRRLHVVWTHDLSSQPPGSVVPMSGLWLVVPLAILGVGEAFHIPGQVSLYYQEFPKSLRSTSTAMMALLIGIGYYLSSAIIGLIHRSTGWLPDNINEGRLDKVFWTLAVIGGVNFGYYVICAKMFKYHDVEKHGGEDSFSSGLAQKGKEDI